MSPRARHDADNILVQNEGRPLFDNSSCATPSPPSAGAASTALQLTHAQLLKALHHAGAARGTAFAWWDTWLFVPLCLLLALGCLVVVVSEG